MMFKYFVSRLLIMKGFKNLFRNELLMLGIPNTHCGGISFIMGYPVQNWEKFVR